MKTPEYIEVVKVTENFEVHYHIKPSNGKYQFYPTALIPVNLFKAYIRNRTKMLDYRKQIKHYFKPSEDKPMRVEKNHVNEGEIHRFNPDGSIIINP